RLLWMGVGKQDSLHDRLLAVHQILDKGGVNHIWEESEGGHVWGEWRTYLTEFASLLFQNPPPDQPKLMPASGPAPSPRKPTADSYLNQSLALYQAGKYPESIAAAREALKLRPDFAA